MKQLPQAIHMMLCKEYLSRRDSFTLLSCSKVLFEEIRPSLLFFSLNHKESSQYLSEPDFRNQILSRIRDPTKQLCLKLGRFSLPLAVLSEELWVHSCVVTSLAVSLVFSTLMPNLHVEEEWKLRSCTGSFDEVTIGAVRRMTLMDLQGLQQLSPLRCEMLEEVTISHCHAVSDLSPLKGCKKVTISDCINIRDLSSLVAVRDLFIEALDNVTELPSLPHLEKITVLTCPRINSFDTIVGCRYIRIESKDLSRLSSFTACTSLRLHRCFSLQDIGGDMQQLPKLRLLQLHCIDVVGHELSSLCHLYSVEFVFCTLLNDVSMLGQIPRLSIENCEQVSSFAGLGRGNRFFTYKGQISKKDITDFSPLKGIEVVSLSSCKGLTSEGLAQLEDIRHLTIDINSNPLDLTFLPTSSLLSLELSNLYAAWNLSEGLRCLKSLTLKESPLAVHSLLSQPGAYERIVVEQVHWDTKREDWPLWLQSNYIVQTQRVTARTQRLVLLKKPEPY